jgi:hypothetical protein
MKRVMPILGVLGAIATACAMLAYPFVPEAMRHWVLYYGFCFMALTFAVVCLMAAKSMEVIIKFAKQIEARKERGKIPPRQDPPGTNGNKAVPT